MACGAHVPRTVGFSCTSTLVPNGANGVRLKSNGPFIIASADMQGLRRDGRKRFSVRFVCANNLSHNCSGKRGSNPHRIVIK